MMLLRRCIFSIYIMEWSIHRVCSNDRVNKVGSSALDASEMQFLRAESCTDEIL